MGKRGGAVVNVKVDFSPETGLAYIVGPIEFQDLDEAVRFVRSFNSSLAPDPETGTPVTGIPATEPEPAVPVPVIPRTGPEAPMAEEEAPAPAGPDLGALAARAEADAKPRQTADRQLPPESSARAGASRRFLAAVRETGLSYKALAAKIGKNVAWINNRVSGTVTVREEDYALVRSAGPQTAAPQSEAPKTERPKPRFQQFGNTGWIDD